VAGSNSRAKKKAGDRAAQKAAAAAQVWIPIPDEFLDLNDESWTLLRARGEIEEMELVEVLRHTLRRTSGTTHGDGEKALDILNHLKQYLPLDHEPKDGEEEPEVIQMSRDDFDWMQTQFKEQGGSVWTNADAAYLVRWLQNNVFNKDPREEDEEVASKNGRKNGTLITQAAVVENLG